MKLNQVWTVAYDGTPMMDGPQVIRQGEFASRELADGALLIVSSRSKQAPKKNLRIETRMVSDWVEEK